MPRGVMNERSTTAVVVVGLKRERSNAFESLVVPDAKYQLVAVARVHGAADHPSGPATDWVTSTPPPSICTLVATQVPETMSEGVTTASLRAGTETARLVREPTRSVT